MATRKRSDAKPLNEPAKAAAEDESGIYLDPELARIRDEEMKALESITVEPRPEPTIDPELVKLRDEEIKRGDKKIV
jgi:hypothetical protein